MKLVHLISFLNQYIYFRAQLLRNIYLSRNIWHKPGDNLEIPGRVWKLFKRAFAHENFPQIRLKIKNEKCSVQFSEAILAWMWTCKRHCVLIALENRKSPVKNETFRGKKWCLHNMASGLARLCLITQSHKNPGPGLVSSVSYVYVPTLLEEQLCKKDIWL